MLSTVLRVVVHRADDAPQPRVEPRPFPSSSARPTRTHPRSRSVPNRTTLRPSRAPRTARRGRPCAPSPRFPPPGPTASSTRYRRRRTETVPWTAYPGRRATPWRSSATPPSRSRRLPRRAGPPRATSSAQGRWRGQTRERNPVRNPPCEARHPSLTPWRRSRLRRAARGGRARPALPRVRPERGDPAHELADPVAAIRRGASNRLGDVRAAPLAHLPPVGRQHGRGAEGPARIQIIHPESQLGPRHQQHRHRPAERVTGEAQLCPVGRRRDPRRHVRPELVRHLLDPGVDHHGGRAFPLVQRAWPRLADLGGESNAVHLLVVPRGAANDHPAMGGRLARALVADVPPRAVRSPPSA